VRKLLFHSDIPVLDTNKSKKVVRVLVEKDKLTWPLWVPERLVFLSPLISPFASFRMFVACDSLQHERQWHCLLIDHQNIRPQGPIIHYTCTCVAKRMSLSHIQSMNSSLSTTPSPLASRVFIAS
jgi:hypothetical protein